MARDTFVRFALADKAESTQYHEDVLRVFLASGSNPGHAELLARKLMTLKRSLGASSLVFAMAMSYYRIAKNDITGDGRVGSLIVELTKQCGNACSHCYAWSGDLQPSMSEATLERVLQFASRYCKHVFLTGGDPFLDLRVFTIAKTHPDIVFFVFTTGQSLNAKCINLLKGLSNVIPMLGIDGASASMHDRIRGLGAYKAITEAIERLQQAKLPWGFIALVAEVNAGEVLNPLFVTRLRSKGALVGRFIEYVPVGPKAIPEYVLSGNTYMAMERRRNAIIASGEIYMQQTQEDKCSGILFCDVNGNLKCCPFMHYSKHSIGKGRLQKNIADTLADWRQFLYEGECPIYSDAPGLRNHLLRNGWHSLLHTEEPIFTEGNEISKLMTDNYKEFLRKAKCRNEIHTRDPVGL